MATREQPLMIPGYAIEGELHRGKLHVVYRARRARDDTAVILKALRDEYPAAAHAARLRREYEILRNLDVEGAARARDLVVHRDRPTLVLEYAPGGPLKPQIPADGLPLKRFFDVAVPLAATVGRLQQRGIVHKDINPSNLLFDPGTARLTLIDFGIATRLSPGRTSMQSVNLYEGTIAYMSPEQTGRMNCDLDYRTDFYSLGVTFYELLTGQLPFSSSDALEVIHGHIARTPLAPHEANPRIPTQLSAVVMKLMAKSADDRYQSPAGLESDLRRAAEEWTRTGDTRGLVVGRDDVSDRFSVPQRLYGRETEVAALAASFERVCRGGNELVLVSGYSGIGKTALVHELHKSLAGHAAQFAAGKFDQLGRDVPYVGVVQALRGVVRHWLTEPEARMREWGDRVRDALCPNGRLICDVIPELERVIGPQPEVSPLDPSEAQHRFNLTMRRFVGVIAQPEHPLVLFLDDLQWADRATLSLIPLLLGGGESRGLLLVSAFRDHEVSPTHPLHGARAELRARGVPVLEVALSALDGPSLRALIADALRSRADDVREIAALVEAKTGGNPFFVTQFLRTLHQEGLLTLDRDRREWRVDLAAIRGQNITDNVVELMFARIQRLPPATRSVLRLAACVGARFDLATLSTIAEGEPVDVAKDLWDAVVTGLVRVESGADELWPCLDPQLDAAQIQLRFLHDRVQQAAYEQIPDDARHAVHLEVGRLLLARGDRQVRESIFEVVNHLNVGRDLIAERPERLRLAELNLEAGRRARASGAYASAAVYLEIGAALAGDGGWACNHDLAFALNLERCEADYLCGRFELAESGLRALLPRSRSPLEAAEVRLREIALYETMSRYDDAIAAGLAGVRALGVEVPETVAGWKAALDEELRAIEHLRGDRSVEALLELPRLTDPSIHKAMRLLMAIWAPAYITAQESLRCCVAARMVRLSLQAGNCEESAFGYVHHGATVASTLGDYSLGFEFGRLALALNQRLADARLEAVVHHRFAAMVNLWIRPFESCVTHAQRAVQSGRESGHLQVAAYAQFQQTFYAMQIEPDLERFEQCCTRSIATLADLKNPAFLEAQRLILQWGRALQGRTATPTGLSSADFDESAFRRGVGNGGIFRGIHASIRLELLDTFQQVEDAYRAVEEGEPVAERFASTIWPALFAFRSALALCAWLPGAPERARDSTLERLDALERRLRSWAKYAPENFGHWHRLAAAEIARVRGEAGAAMERYEDAIALAERQVSPRHRALANELYGRFWLERGQPQFAGVLLQEARFGFAQWGAAAKVLDMDRRYAGLLTPAPATTAGQDSDAPPPHTTSVERATALDAVALARAGRLLSGEIELPRLLEALLRLVLQSAGARRACLLLDRGGQWRVEALGVAEPERMEVLQGTPLDDCADLPHSVVNLVARGGETLALDDAADDPGFGNDPYLARARPRSLLCTPVSHQSRLIGVLYLENDLTRGAFTSDRVEMLQLLSAQAAVSIQNAELFSEVHRLHERARAENVYLQEEIKTRQGFEEIVGRSPQLRRALKQVEQVAETDTTVLITGETGTGKELLARAIHRLSPRRDHPLITVNCGAISPGLVESDLFGHERGAFTGAVTRKIGRFEIADGGTLFLDEIGDLALELQVKLLRVLQEGEFERVGGTKPIRVDVRLVTATHRDLAQLVREGRFREDLFYRLHVFPIRTPPLRERPEDIPALVRHFAIRYGLKMGKKIEAFPRKVLDELMAYAWPGNIRELGNVIERAVILSTGPVLELGEWAPTVADAPAAIGSRRLADVERDHVLATLVQTGWRVSGSRGAARVLGLKPTTLEARMKRLGIQRPS